MLLNHGDILVRDFYIQHIVWMYVMSNKSRALSYHTQVDTVMLNVSWTSFVKVTEKCTNFYYGTEKLPPKF